MISEETKKLVKEKYVRYFGEVVGDFEEFKNSLEEPYIIADVWKDFDVFLIEILDSQNTMWNEIIILDGEFTENND